MAARGTGLRSRAPHATLRRSYLKERIADFKLDSTVRRLIFWRFQENSRTMRLIRLLIALARMRLGRWLIQSGAKLIEAGTWLIKMRG